MTYSVVVINQRDLKRKLAKPQSQLNLADELLIVCTENRFGTQGEVFALEYNSPAMPERWTVQLPMGYTTRFSAFSSKHKLLLLSVSNWHTTVNDNSFLLALDTSTGREIWRYPAEHGYINDISTPILIGDSVFFVSNRHAFLLPLSQPWQIIWTVPFPFDYPWLNRSITLDGEMLYVSVKKSGVIALSQASGKLEKHYKLQTEEGEARLGATVDNHHVFVGTSTGWLVAFDKANSNRMWRRQLGQEITCGPFINHPYIFAGCKTTTQNAVPAYQICATHIKGKAPCDELFQSFILGSQSHFSAPLAITSNQSLLCGSNNASLYFLDSLTGRKLWRHIMPKGIYCHPLVTPTGLIIVADRNSNISILRDIKDSGTSFFSEELEKASSTETIDPIEFSTKETMPMGEIISEESPNSPLHSPRIITSKIDLVEPKITKESLSEYHQKISDIETVVDRIKLRDILHGLFGIVDLKDICFEFFIDYEDINGENKMDTILGLIVYCERHNLFERLVTLVKQKRPNIIQWLSPKQSKRSQQ